MTTLNIQPEQIAIDLWRSLRGNIDTRNQGNDEYGHRIYNGLMVSFQVDTSVYGYLQDGNTHISEVDSFKEELGDFNELNHRIVVQFLFYGNTVSHYRITSYDIEIKEYYCCDWTMLGNHASGWSDFDNVVKGTVDQVKQYIKKRKFSPEALDLLGENMFSVYCSTNGVSNNLVEYVTVYEKATDDDSSGYTRQVVKIEQK